MSRRRSFPPELLDALRATSLFDALGLLGLYWKKDADFLPLKNQTTVRVHVTVDGGVVELLITDLKWYDTRAALGGGGAIDLTLHLLRLSFVDAVRLLASHVNSFTPRKEGG